MTSGFSCVVQLVLSIIFTLMRFYVSWHAFWKCRFLFQDTGTVCTIKAKIEELGIAQLSLNPTGPSGTSAYLANNY